jgi:hypothetical protein
MNRCLLAAALLVSSSAWASQTIVLDWDPPSAEAASLIGYVVRGKQVPPNDPTTATTLATVDVTSTATLTLADGPWYLWVRACWAPAATNCEDGTWTAAVGPVGNAATAYVDCGDDGTCDPDTYEMVLKGQYATITVTPDSGLSTQVGGTCGGSLGGTVFTTSALYQDCTVDAYFCASLPCFADVISPTISSAAINAAGDTLTVGFSEAVTLNGAIPTLASDFLPVTLSSPSSGSATSHTWSTSRTIDANEVLHLAYAQPGDGIEDAAGNDLLSVEGRAVTNGSTATVLTEVTLSPADKSYFGRSVAAVTFEADTDAAAECVYTMAVGMAWDDQAAMTTSDDLEHTATIAVVSGGVYRYCAQCRDASTLLALPPQCVRWAVEPAPRW